MKTSNVTLTFDADKLEALAFHLEQTGGTVEGEMELAIQKLYEKHVPASVRAFIERDSSKIPPKRSKRPAKPVPDLRTPISPTVKES